MSRFTFPEPTDLKVSRLAAAAAFGVAACLCAPAAAQSGAADELALFHRFEMPAKLSWGAVSIPLTAVAAWRVGAIDGPPASAAQLQAALARWRHAARSGAARLEIVGVCQGWVEGPTTYPCGFAVRGLHLGRAGGEGFSAITTDLGPAGAAQVRATSSPRADLAAAGLIAPVLDTPRAVAVQLPGRFLAEHAAAAEGLLKFEYRAVSNALVPSVFDRASARVVLRATSDAVAQAVDSRR